jgi:hypothetical protein
MQLDALMESGILKRKSGGWGVAAYCRQWAGFLADSKKWKCAKMGEGRAAALSQM